MMCSAVLSVPEGPSYQPRPAKSVSSNFSSKRMVLPPGMSLLVPPLPPAPVDELLLPPALPPDPLVDVAPWVAPAVVLELSSQLRQRPSKRTAAQAIFIMRSPAGS